MEWRRRWWEGERRGDDAPGGQAGSPVPQQGFHVFADVSGAAGEIALASHATPTGGGRVPSFFMGSTQLARKIIYTSYLDPYTDVDCQKKKMYAPLPGGRTISLARKYHESKFLLSHAVVALVRTTTPSLNVRAACVLLLNRKVSYFFAHSGTQFRIEEASLMPSAGETSYPGLLPPH